MARPSIYSKELVDTICKQIIEGKSLRSICNQKNMPNRDTVYQWLKDGDKKEFSNQYAQARRLQAESLVDKVLDILEKDRETMIEVNDARLKVDAIKWLAGKLDPKKYGEKQQIDANISTDNKLRDMTDDELQAILRTRSGQGIIK